MKKCSKCLLYKEESEFNFKNEKTGKLNSNCKDCHKLYRDKHYRENRAKYISKSYERKSRYRLEFYQWLGKQSCKDCGNSDMRVLEFDHLRDKKFNISDKVGHFTMKSLQKEISKCDVVCANCHRIRTANQFSYYSYMEDEV